MADQFDSPSPERLYDATFPSINAWAQARLLTSPKEGDSRLDPIVRENVSKAPTVPFVPLTREIGVTPVDDIEIIDFGRKELSTIAVWVSRSRSIYDLVQRAEGFEEPSSVYYGAQHRVANTVAENSEESGKNVPKQLRSEVGRAAVHRQYEQTTAHYLIAKERADKASEYMLSLKQGTEVSHEGFIAITESLQELANGLAANIDNLFPGGDEQAQVYGNSILVTMVALEKGEKTINGAWNLINTAIKYVRKQEKLWYTKMQRIVSFGVQYGFYVGKPGNEKTQDIA